MGVSINKEARWAEIGKTYFNRYSFFEEGIIVYFKPIDDSYAPMKKGEIYYLNSSGTCENLEGDSMGRGLNSDHVYWIGTTLKVIHLGGE